MYSEIEKLEPKAFFKWFCAVSKIPRGSRKEQHIIAYLQEFARQRNIYCETDETGNVFMRLPPSAGYETQAPILFQAHMDIVCDQDPDISFNFETDPIPLVIDGDLVRARGTTLGADNAVGIATMLALADDPSIPHPELELLFTVEEEVGMQGIRSFDVAKLKARRMINMDCGDSHVLCVSSAGKVVGEIRQEFPCSPVMESETVLTLTLDGGLGGHSGICANKGRCCMGNALGDLLAALDGYPVRLCSLYGNKPILKAVEAAIALPKEALSKITALLESRFAQLRSVYAHTDPDIRMTLGVGDADAAVSPEATGQIVTALSLLRAGQFRADGNDPRIIMTLGLLSHVSLTAGLLKIDFAVRSTNDADQALLFSRYQRLCRLVGMDLVQISEAPGWPERPDSPFRDKFQRVHTQLFGSPAELERAPGGVEVSMVVNRLADMDAVGIAPTARGAHTTSEHLYIRETQPYWSLIQAVLAEKE